MTSAVIPLPVDASRHCPRGVGEVECPYCRAKVGPDTRCPHLDVLLTPKEADGRWSVLMCAEPFDLPPLKMSAPKVKPKPHTKQAGSIYGHRIAAVRHALAFGRGTWHDVAARVEFSDRVVKTSLFRLCNRGEAEIIQRGGPMQPSVYALTAKGREINRLVKQ